MTTTRTIAITPSVSVGGKEKLLLIAGPCQIESREHCLRIADFLATLAQKLPVSMIFKSSFDKANRTSGSSARGVGIQEGLRILSDVRASTGLPLLTDIHSPEQAAAAAEVVDVLQTPAFLCRQTDLLLAVGKTGKTVNVKKGQFLPPEDMKFAAEKIASTGNNKILLCERGSCFGYRDLVVDMRSLIIMRQTGYPVVFDATHSVQSMGGAGGASGGNRQFIAPLIRAAAGIGIDGLFIECHNDPDKAPSDGANMLRLEDVASVVTTACKIRAIAESHV